MENQDYFIDRLAVIQLAENQIYANRTLKGVYEKTLGVTGADNMFQQFDWFRDIIEVAFALDIGVWFRKTTTIIEEDEKTLVADFNPKSSVIHFDKTLEFYDMHNQVLCSFSVCKLSNEHIAEIIKTFVTEYE